MHGARSGEKISMPQSERAQVIKSMLSWLVEQPKGATVGDIIRYVELEITDMGASTRTIRSYIERCRRQNLITSKGTHILCTEMCKKWLQRKVS